MNLICCNRSQRAEIMAIAPYTIGATYEVALYLPHCTHCTKPKLLLYAYGEDGGIFCKTGVNPKKIVKTLEKLTVLWKPKTLSVPVFKGKYYLNYNHYGKVRKCWSNLYRVRDGSLPFFDEDLKYRKENPTIRNPQTEA